MIQKDIVREACQSYLVYNRGRELQQAGYIKTMQKEPETRNGHGVININAKVQGSGINLYRVTALVNEELSEIEDASCTCPAFYNYDGLCKHCTAVLLEYIKKRDAKALSTMSSASRGITPGRSSSYGLSRLINQYKEKERVSYRQSEIRETIRLVPFVSAEYGHLQVEFKIGTKKLYVLKDFMQFANAVNQGKSSVYGKVLEFYHTMDAFTPESRPFVEFLLREAENSKQTYKGWGTYYGASGNRFVSLHSNNLDDFLEAVGDSAFSVEMNYKPRRDWQVAHEEYKPMLLLKGTEDGALLKVKPIFYTCGRKLVYLWEEGWIYSMPIGRLREIEPFWEYINDYKYEEFFVSKAELPSFCGELLPILERYYVVEKQQFQEKMYLPPEAEYEIYLDAPDKHSVTCEVFAVYDGIKYNIYDKPRILENRDEIAELKVEEQIKSWFQATDPQKKHMVLAGDDDRLYQLLTEGMEKLQKLGTVFVSDNLKAIQIVQPPTVSVGVSLKGELLELTLDSEEMPLSQLIEILSSYNRKRKFFRLKNGDFLSMEEDGLAVLWDMQKRLSISPSQWGKEPVAIPKFRAPYLDGELREQNRFHAVKNRDFKSLVRNMKTVEDNDFEVPKGLEKILREYQKQGFLWLKTLKFDGFGGILADDMGLGKTLQVIAFLLSEWEEKFPFEERKHDFAVAEEVPNHHFALIVCPASLVYNWKSEMERFAPALHAVTVTGSATEREEILKNSGREDILITSYELLRRDFEIYRECIFDCEIIDEAQYIKNHNTKAAKAVKQIRAGFKTALTGTPIENRLSELWSIFDYLMPGFLYTYKRFREEVEVPIVVKKEEDAIRYLQKMIRPFVLRRLKKDVLKDLPEKLEEAVFAKLEGEQEKLYHAHVQRIKIMLDRQSEEEFATQKIQILAELTKLRQLCCDPALIYENFHEESAKMVMCLDLIKNAVDGGHKILLFSQFTSMLSRIQEELKKEGIEFYSLTGATSKERRAELVEKFQKGEVPVFCISLKAGGTGLNLTAADIVIHYDPWWNVAVQNQATDRAHRIGQKNPVTVYKLIAKNTIEENILKLQEKKSELAEQLLGNEGFEDVKFTREEILKLLG